jgi:hypothetical protein
MSVKERTLENCGDHAGGGTRSQAKSAGRDLGLDPSVEILAPPAVIVLLALPRSLHDIRVDRRAPGSYPDIDGLFQEQAAELDRNRRGALLQKIQQLMHDKAMFAPIWQLAFLNGVGPRLEESGLGLISGHAYSAPYEDVTLKSK